MLSHINWQQYLAVVGLSVIAYYLIVLWLLYRKQLLRFLAGKRKTSFRPLAVPPPSGLMGAIREDVDGPGTEKTALEAETISNQSLAFSIDDPTPNAYPNEAAISDTFDELEQLSIRLRLLMEKSGKKANRTLLTEKIRQELAGFSAKTSPENFKEAINRFIRQQCKELCNVRIEPADLKVIWS